MCRNSTIWKTVAAVLLVCIPLVGFAGEATPVQFKTSCNADVQAEFNRAVTLLHSFEYPETVRIFESIIEKDADCAMARWGVAMSTWHPLWAPPSAADLEAGARILAEAMPLQKTPRESAYIEALNVFFSSADTSTHRSRVGRYAAQMNDVYSTYLDDPEAAVFYALALLASADPHDKSYANQFKAAGLLNWVRASQPQHPGVLHYLIHSYDFPGLAHLSLDAALIYADAAPDSAHAQHMPSHIFTRLGLWERSLSSNQDSTQSAAEYTKRAGLPGHYDEGLHSMDYLLYALLQTGRDTEAKQLLERLGRIEKTDTENFKVAYAYAAGPARYVLERRAWQEASQLSLIREDFAWDNFRWARSIHHFARGIGAARSGQLDLARQEWAHIKTLQQNTPDTTLPYWREEIQVHLDALQSWILLAESQAEKALELARAAANREDAVDKHPVTPGEVVPARELYAEMLLASGHYGEALAQYRLVLDTSPNRLNALIGLATAAEKSGVSGLAEQYFSIAREQTKAGGGWRVISDVLGEKSK